VPCDIDGRHPPGSALRPAEGAEPFVGGDLAISHRGTDLAMRIREATGGRGADLVYDVVGGETAGAAVKALARNGRIAIVGFASGVPVTLNAVDLLLRNYSAVGVLADAHSPALQEAAWSHLAELAEAGKLATPVGRIWSFDEVPDMIAQQTNPPAGKVVVKVS
jgi:NADPH2:quinone reductase